MYKWWSQRAKKYCLIIFPFLHGFSFYYRMRILFLSLPSFLSDFLFQLCRVCYCILSFVFPGQCVLAPALALIGHVTLHSPLFSRPQCPHSRGRAEAGGGELDSCLVLILNLKAHHPTSVVSVIRAILPAGWGSPKTWQLAVQQKQAGVRPGLGPAPWWSGPPCILELPQRVVWECLLLSFSLPSSPVDFHAMWSLLVGAAS